ncbi:MAG: DUF5668 domain-containing protein [Patescibacteria group bacterium]|nr:DUF5668 domain-containing protein [Patescibacteria group bacterium]
MKKKYEGFFENTFDFTEKLLLVLVGVILLLVNLGFLSYEWLAYWPVILIVLGLKAFLEDKD